MKVSEKPLVRQLPELGLGCRRMAGSAGTDGNVGAASIVAGVELKMVREGLYGPKAVRAVLVVLELGVFEKDPPIAGNGPNN